jgi:hypothetical protein
MHAKVKYESAVSNFFDECSYWFGCVALELLSWECALSVKRRVLGEGSL